VQADEVARGSVDGYGTDYARNRPWGTHSRERGDWMH